MKITSHHVESLIQSNARLASRPGPGQLASRSRGIDSVQLSNLAQAVASTQRMLVDHVTEESAFEFTDESLVFDNVAGTDLSPEGVSDTIVGFAEDLHDLFTEQNGHLEQKEINERFEEKIRAGIDNGYDRAAGILDAMQTPDDVRSYSVATKELIDRKLDVFLAGLDLVPSEGEVVTAKHQTEEPPSPPQIPEDPTPDPVLS